MSEPVRLFNAAGEWFDCVAPSEVVRLLASGDWRREPWPKAAPAAPIVEDDDLPFAAPLPAEPKAKRGRPRKGGGAL